MDFEIQIPLGYNLGFLASLLVPNRDIVAFASYTVGSEL